MAMPMVMVISQTLSNHRIPNRAHIKTIFCVHSAPLIFSCTSDGHGGGRGGAPDVSSERSHESRTQSCVSVQPIEVRTPRRQVRSAHQHWAGRECGGPALLQHRDLRRPACCLRGQLFFFSSRRRHTRCSRDWSSDVCSSDLSTPIRAAAFPLPIGPCIFPA